MNNIKSLLGLYIAILLLPLILSLFVIVGHMKMDYGIISDEIAIAELREVLILAYDVKVNEDSLHFLYQGEEYTLSLVNQKLLLQPGTMIYLNEIDSLFFYPKNQSIYIAYERKGKQIEKAIASQTSLSVFDVFDCNDECISDTLCE